MDVLLDTSRMLESDQHAELGRRGLTPTSTHALWAIRHGGPSTQAALANTLEVTPRHITTLIDALEHKGLVARKTHPSDRRAVLVALSPDGEALMTAMSAEYSELSDALLAGLRSDELASALTVLELVRDRLRTMTAEGTRS